MATTLDLERLENIQRHGHCGHCESFTTISCNEHQTNAVQMLTKTYRFLEFDLEYLLLVVSTHMRNISQIGSFPQTVLKIKISNLWNHQPVSLVAARKQTWCYAAVATSNRSSAWKSRTGLTSFKSNDLGSFNLSIHEYISTPSASHIHFSTYG